MLRIAREFFTQRGVLEVETPLLGAATVTDPHIDSMVVALAGTPTPSYLATSPEYAMKRLLAAGSGDIYQICKAFRDAERGRWHNPEFTLIEWYRLGFDDHTLMAEVEALVRALLATFRSLAPAEHLSYSQAFEQYAQLDIGRASDAQLARAAREAGIHGDTQLDRDAMLDLIIGTVVGPKLGWQRPCFLCDYPASQASLARLKPGKPPVAARFELYLNGIELANGFHELADAAEQRARFARDLQLRRSAGRSLPAADERLLAALDSGLPDCAGVALGFDRLVAVALDANGLADVMAFTSEHA